MRKICEVRRACPSRRHAAAEEQASRFSSGNLRSELAAFHGDRERSGWNPNETVLTPSNVAGGNFGVLWDMTAPLDGDGTGNPPHLYAAPLYVDTVVMTTPDLAGLPFSVIFAASRSTS